MLAYLRKIFVLIFMRVEGLIDFLDFLDAVIF